MPPAEPLPTELPESINVEEPEKNPTGHEREKILQRCRDRRAYADEKDKDNRDNQAKDTRFVYVPGAQWDADIVAKRTGWGDPCLEFPQLKQFINQVVNDARQNRPGIRVHAASGDASKEVADIIQGMIRVIEYDSRAEAIYDCAYQGAVVGGRGYLRVVAEYADPKSFDQSLRLKRIPDTNAVRMDPDYQEPDASDINWCFVEERVHKDEFTERWPKAQPISIEDGFRAWWTDDDHVTVADYYERVCERRTLVALQNGTVAYKEDLVKLFERAGGELMPGVILRERETEEYKVKWYTIAGGEQILETHKWPGKTIPVVCAMGDEIMVDGRRIFQGLITQAKSAQALFNYGMTQQAIHLALTPRAPYIAAIGQVEEFKEQWEEANNRNFSVLVYNPITVDGVIVPAPQRTPPASPDAGWINWTQQMQMLMKSTIGMYENSLGMKGGEVSGRAITAREKQGDTSTYHYADNLSRAISLTGRIIVECIPYYYDTQRIVHIMGDDDKRKAVTVNEQQPGPPDPSTGAIEAITKNDIRTGTYAVTVSSGPGYETKRQEAAEMYMQLVQADPGILQVAGDLIVKTQDIPGAMDLAERLRTTLPPPIQAMLAAKEAGQDPKMAALLKQQQDLQQQLQQGQQQLADLQKQLQDEKNDKAASIAASNARQAVAEASGQHDQADAAAKVQEALMKHSQEQEKRDGEREQRHNDRFDTLCTLLANLVKAQATSQQIEADAQSEMRAAATIEGPQAP